MGKETPSTLKALEAATKATTLRIHFPDVTVTEAGANLSITGAKPTPTLSVSADALKKEGAAAAAAPDAKYILVSIDPDAPFPSFPFLGPVLHGLHADLVPGPATAADADGFLPLAGRPEGEQKKDEGEEEWLVPYIGPGPPKPSSAHRYVFLVYEQPAALDAAAIRKLLGFGPTVGLTSRIRWDQEGFEKKLGLGEVLAGNYFLTHA